MEGRYKPVWAQEFTKYDFVDVFGRHHRCVRDHKEGWIYTILMGQFGPVERTFTADMNGETRAITAYMDCDKSMKDDRVSTFMREARQAYAKLYDMDNNF